MGNGLKQQLQLHGTSASAYLTLKTSLGKGTLISILQKSKEAASDLHLVTQLVKGKTNTQAQVRLALTCPFPRPSPALPKPFLTHAFQENVYSAPAIPALEGRWALHPSTPQPLGLFWETERWIRNLKIWFSLRILRYLSPSAFWPQNHDEAF